MAKKKHEKSEPTAGEQLDLIDVSPENSKQIVGIARRYKTAQAQRIAALEREVEEKQKLLGLIKDAKLKPLDDGVIRFKVDGLLITVKPRDELVKVKEESEESGK